MALGGSAAAAPMVSSSSSGGAGRPVSALASVPLRRGCCCCCPFYSRGCDLNLYLSVSSLQTPPRSRHRLPCPAGRVEGAEAGGGAAAAAAPRSALWARCAAPGAVRFGAGGGVTWPPSRCPPAAPAERGPAEPIGPDAQAPAAPARAGAGTPLLSLGMARRRSLSQTGFLFSNRIYFIFYQKRGGGGEGVKWIFQSIPIFFLSFLFVAVWIFLFSSPPATPWQTRRGSGVSRAGVTSICAYRGSCAASWSLR